MLDPLWQAVHDALLPRLHDGDVVLAPEGGWPDFPCPTRFYRDAIELGEATVIVLHKARLAGMGRSELERVATQWTRLFVNGVFVVFSRDRRKPVFGNAVRGLVYRDAVGRHLVARRNRVLRHRIFYLHLPKAAGSSMSRALSTALPSSIYYNSAEQMLRNPPGEDYDLIGGHVLLSGIAPYLAETDWVIGMMRNPADRFRSAFLHARRPGEDAGTFSPAMRAMRELPIRDFLATRDGRIEARLQLLMLSEGPERGFPEAGDAPSLAKAVTALDDARVLIAPSEAPQVFLDRLARRLNLSLPRVGHENRNDYRARAADVDEFDAALAAINAENAVEQELYRQMSRRFARDAKAGPNWSAGRHRRRDDRVGYRDGPAATAINRGW